MVAMTTTHRSDNMSVTTSRSYMMTVEEEEEEEEEVVDHVGSLVRSVRYGV